MTQQLGTEKHCAIYENELNRVWPRLTPGRETKIRQFAEENGWRLRFYSEGLCAIFDKLPPKRKAALPGSRYGYEGKRLSAFRFDQHIDLHLQHD